jgi:drug/metabolite transporter (DMT)-like permease
MSRSAATLVGFAAVLMWSLLALLTVASGAVPPFQLAAMSLAVGAGLGLIWIAGSRGAARLGHVPAGAWLLGVAGLFGYHLFYFTALRNAPPVEAGLIAYLWPLLIVVLSALLPGERLGAHHVAGAVLGFLGAGLIVAGGAGLAPRGEFAIGYLAALACALIWSTYSVASRRYRGVPSHAVAGFCLAAAALSAIAHLAVETTVWPATVGEWLAVAGLGLGPVGAAFYFWDHGVKHGDIQVLGAAAYGAPLLSTLILIAAGLAQPTWTVAAACLLITGGAVLAAKDLVFSAQSGPGSPGSGPR